MSELDECTMEIVVPFVTVSIPDHLGNLLDRIMVASRFNGISFIHLAADGYEPTLKAIEELRELGALIEEEHREEHLWAGDQTGGIPHFMYHGWRIDAGQILSEKNALKASK